MSEPRVEELRQRIVQLERGHDEWRTLARRAHERTEEAERRSAELEALIAEAASLLGALSRRYLGEGLDASVLHLSQRIGVLAPPATQETKP